MDRIDDLRSELDRIDRSIIGLIADRMRISVAIGQEKASNNIPVLDDGRESEVRARWHEASAERGLDQESMGQVLDIILAQSRKVQEVL